MPSVWYLLFDDAGSPSSSPPLLSTSVNNIYTKYKNAATKKSSPILDDKCVLTILRSSFIQTVVGELKTGARKQVSIRNTRRAAINEFDNTTYSKKKFVHPLGNRRSARNIRSEDATSDTIDFEMTSGKNHNFDLSNRNIRRYVIEDIMFMSVGELVTLLVNIEYGNTKFWEDITEIHQFAYDSVMIGGASFYQIPSRVRSNNRKDEFVNGYHDNDTLNYLVLNKGDAGLTVDVVVKGDNSCLDGVELKFSGFFLNDQLQIWGKNLC